MTCLTIVAGGRNAWVVRRGGSQSRLQARRSCDTWSAGPSTSPLKQLTVSSRTYVCFRCRTTERVPLPRINKTCRKCRNKAEHVFYKFRIPAGRDDRAWADLQVRVRAYNREAKARVVERLEREQAWLERILSETPDTRFQKRRSLEIRVRLNRKRMAEWLQW